MTIWALTAAAVGMLIQHDYLAAATCLAGAGICYELRGLRGSRPAPLPRWRDVLPRAPEAVN